MVSDMFLIKPRERKFTSIIRYIIDVIDVVAIIVTIVFFFKPAIAIITAVINFERQLHQIAKKLIKIKRVIMTMAMMVMI